MLKIPLFKGLLLWYSRIEASEKGEITSYHLIFQYMNRNTVQSSEGKLFQAANSFSILDPTVINLLHMWEKVILTTIL